MLKVHAHVRWGTPLSLALDNWVNLHKRSAQPKIDDLLSRVRESIIAIVFIGVRGHGTHVRKRSHIHAMQPKATPWTWNCFVSQQQCVHSLLERAMAPNNYSWVQFPTRIVHTFSTYRTLFDRHFFALRLQLTLNRFFSVGYRNGNVSNAHYLLRQRWPLLLWIHCIFHYCNAHNRCVYDFELETFLKKWF